MRSRFDDPRARRRLYLERGLRKRPIGSGSNLDTLMQHEREKLFIDMESLFGDIPATVVGGVATRAYAPERHTKDIDVLIDHARYGEGARRLEALGWRKEHALLFPNSSLGLYGTAWSKDGRHLDVIATAQPWAAEALAEEVYDQTGLRVVSLPYLVLMKLDSARGIDQGDLTRMLGRVEGVELERIVRIVERHHPDPHAAEDVRQYAELGALEYETPTDSG
jgi:hypothetical protein